MQCSAYFGEISEQRKNEWNCQDDNPYGVLQDSIQLHRKGHNLWNVGDKYFNNRIQVDWGSYAWKSTSEEIIDFLKGTRTSLSWLVEDDEQQIRQVRDYIKNHGNTQYGIVFVEDY